jgi:hypothetical protein
MNLMLSYACSVYRLVYTYALFNQKCSLSLSDGESVTLNSDGMKVNIVQCYHGDDQAHQ